MLLGITFQTKYFTQFSSQGLLLREPKQKQSCSSGWRSRSLRAVLILSSIHRELSWGGLYPGWLSRAKAWTKVQNSHRAGLQTPNMLDMTLVWFAHMLTHAHSLRPGNSGETIQQAGPISAFYWRQDVWESSVSPWAYFACLCGWVSCDHTNHQDVEAGGYEGLWGQSSADSVGRVRSSIVILQYLIKKKPRLHSQDLQLGSQ